MLRNKIIIDRFELGASPYGILAAHGWLVTYLRMHRNPDGLSFNIETPKGKVTACNGDTIIAYNDGTMDVIYKKRDIVSGQEEWNNG